MDKILCFWKMGTGSGTEGGQSTPVPVPILAWGFPLPLTILLPCLVPVTLGWGVLNCDNDRATRMPILWVRSKRKK